MSAKSVDFDDDAEAELEEAAFWYREREATLPDRLLARVDAAVTAIAERPRSFPRVPGLPTEVEVRSARLRRFPYTLVFVETPTVVRIIAVAHLRRRPLYWAERVKP